MIVMKFGGSSVRDAAALERATEIVRSRAGQRPAVVASAMAGITDALARCGESAHRGREEEALRGLEAEVREHHLGAAEALIPDSERLRRLVEGLEQAVQEVRTLLKGLAILGELTPRSRDALLSYGERLSTLLLAEALREHGLDARWVDARRLIVTDERFTCATPLMAESAARVGERLAPLMERGRIPVTQGFIGATVDGRTTTLGRGGSDYSAAVLGALLRADEIEIWTDVNGVMTADPRVVPDAHTVSELSYAEAAELAYFGAGVLHPRTVAPAVEAGIPIAILNTFAPEGGSTRIVARTRPNDHAVKAITSIRNLSLITVAGRGMLGVPGVAARVFSAVAREGINVLMISQASSEQSICFAVEAGAAPQALAALEQAFELELARHNVERIEAQGEVAIVAAVGAGMRGTPGVAAKVFGALGAHAINVISIAQGSSEYNLSLVVRERNADQAVRLIHEAFELGREG